MFSSSFGMGHPQAWMWDGAHISTHPAVNGEAGRARFDAPERVGWLEARRLGERRLAERPLLERPLLHRQRREGLRLDGPRLGRSRDSLAVQDLADLGGQDR